MTHVRTPPTGRPGECAFRPAGDAFRRRGPVAGLAVVLLAAALAGGCQKTVIAGPGARGKPNVTVRGGTQVDAGGDPLVGTGTAGTAAAATGTADATPGAEAKLVVPQPTAGGGTLSPHPD